MTDHFVKNHDEKDTRKCTKADIRMQASFGGELKKWFEIIDDSMMKMNEKNESTWNVIKKLLTRNRRKASAYTEREKNVRLLNEFVARTRWDILIEEHDKKQLRALTTIAKEKNALHKMMKVSKKYFTEISNKLRVRDVLLRRKIESEG